MQKKLLRQMFLLVLPLSLVLLGVASLQAQDADSPKVTVFAGAGILAANGHAQGEFQVGGSVDQSSPNGWVGYSFETGYLAPWAKLSAGSAFLSADYMASWNLGHSGKGTTSKGTPQWSDLGWKFLPFASAGYTRLFGTGNAVNFGGGFDYRFRHTRAIRVELRDYYSFSTPTQHNVGLRIGYVAYVND